ncbi:MAG: ABC transporter substrate-binding protein [Thermomicrobiales bacterium]
MSNLSRRDALRIGAMVASSALVPSAVRGASPSSPAKSSVQRVAQNDDAQTGIEITIPLDPYGQAVSLDPHRALDWGPLWVTLPYVWSGLLAFDENGAVVPDLAEDVVPGDDASVWTVTIREGLTFASGTPITAQRFVDSWMRALNPSNVAPMATYMQPVLGFAEYVAGTSTDIGFEVIDERTIEIRLTEPISYFPSYLATFVWAVIDLDVVAAAPVDFPLMDAGAGQWRFTEFVENDHMTMEPNAMYWDGASPSVVRITWPFLDSLDASTVGLEQYRNDLLVSLDVPISLSTSIAEDEALAADLIALPLSGSTIAIGMDFNQPPFNDVRIRQAVAASIDKTVWATEIWQDTFVPAMTFTPPSTAQIAGYVAPQALEFDAARADQLVTDAEFQTGDAQTEIIYYQPASDSAEDQQRHAALLQMITDNSGITIVHDTSRTTEQIASLQSDVGGRQFDLVWWWPTSDTPSLLSTIGQSSSPYMAGWFNWNPALEAVGDVDAGEASAEFDRLTLEADQELDAERRNQSYAEAETLLLNNAVLIPLGHWVQTYIQKPWLQGTRQGPWSGRIPVRIDRNVIVVGKPEA